MKILFINHNNDSFIHGISQVAAFSGYKSILWNGTKEFYKICSQFNPDILISNYIDDNIKLYLSKNPKIQSIFKIEENKYNEITNVIYNSFRTDGHIAANIFSGHYPLTKDKKFIICTNIKKNPISEELVGGFLDYKSSIPIKLFSEDNWPGEYYCGRISEPNFSIISNLSWFTLHSGPIDQSVMNAILCHSLVISDNDTIPIIPIVKNYNQIMKEILRLNSNIKEYNFIVNETHKYILNNHTYFHRFDELMNKIGIDSNTVNKLKELV